MISQQISKFLFMISCKTNIYSIKLLFACWSCIWNNSLSNHHRIWILSHEFCPIITYARNVFFMVYFSFPMKLTWVLRIVLWGRLNQTFIFYLISQFFLVNFRFIFNLFSEIDTISDILTFLSSPILNIYAHWCIFWSVRLLIWGWAIHFLWTLCLFI